MIKKGLILLMGLLNDGVMAISVLLLSGVGMFSRKVRTYLSARVASYQGIKELLKEKPGSTIIFCSSVGEFEQVVPLIEEMEARKKNCVILFHSANGYHYSRRLGYAHCYLTPFDFFLHYYYLLWKLKTQVSVVNRHEFWFGFMNAASILGKVYLINVVEKKQALIYSPLFKLAQSLSEHVFFVNKERDLNKHCSSPGDTKTDRIRKRYEREKEQIKLLKSSFPSDKPILVIGSAYGEDAEILRSAFEMESSNAKNWRVVVLPARPYESQRIKQLNFKANDVIVTEEYGTLFHYYALATLIWVGGGFSAGIHNTLEGCFLEKPMISGSKLNHQPDALLMMKSNNLNTFSTALELNQILNLVPAFYSLKNQATRSPTQSILNKIYS
jgi:3-deoxy-D-manno-octulosonic-acid transferase